jgi:hypothetical protein
MPERGSAVFTLLSRSNSTDFLLTTDRSRVFFFIDDVFMLFVLGELPPAVGDSFSPFLH